MAVAGNPNSGKTCMFNNLTGGTQHVGNYPGVTVEFVEGLTRIDNEKYKVIDLPGSYSLTAYSQEEVVARDFILKEKPEVIVNVVDASNLERNLYLTVQLLELKTPIVIALNMVDVAERKGLKIDPLVLSEILGVKVVETVATKNRGMEELKRACKQTVEEKIIPKPLSYSHELSGALLPLEKAVKESGIFPEMVPCRWLALKLLEEDEEILKAFERDPRSEGVFNVFKSSQKHIMFHSGEDSVMAVVEARYGIAAGASRKATRFTESRKRLYTDRIDAVVCNRFMGPLILLGVVYLLFAFVFQLSEEVAWIPLFNGDWTSPVGLFELFFESLAGFVDVHINNPALKSLLRDGIIGGVGGVMGFVPLIFFMFFFISMLEDTGYIARVAFILDRVLRAFGLQGKSILAMIVSGGLGGGGCAVPGVMATRTLREEKDRLVTILVAPIMNCGAKMPVYAMLIAAFFVSAQGAMMFFLWLLSWFFALGSAFCIRKWVVKGEQTPFVMELPVYHIPTVSGVMMHTWNRTWMYIKKAGTIILAINVILWLMMYYPRQDRAPFEKARDKASAVFHSEISQTQFASLFRPSEIDGTFERLSEFAFMLDNQDSTGFEALAKKYGRAALLAKESFEVQKSGKTPGKAVAALEKYRDDISGIEKREAQSQLRYSIAGKIGSALAPVSRLAGFNWKENIALIGGFAAKEVVVGTLGTAYSMGDVDPEDSGSLSHRLAKDEDWSPVKAFAFMVFVMIYAPCFVTVAAIRKETGSWKWAAFAVAYTTFLGFIAAVAIYQLGSLF
jgi:ferrous iron transport protein B